jgi:hypothetical protein
MASSTPRAAERRRDSARVHSTGPSLALTAIVGTYTDPLRGEVEVVLESGRLVGIYGGYTGPVEHWHHDTFENESSGAGRHRPERRIRQG